ncbi:glycoside hydrolase family 88 protein [Lachnoclostridium sp. Marseille-P6806]|uniref:glycoside hydrolase family 88 protein n=1 Tax=Lachnoclostridium sp. Marseille-P6806 TaxID=2364793 RepID=UPI00103069F7|nr:glycoside hydrolase family 88 protein [Lachnoclostridium sp. Marseille-P6806]
MTVLDQIAAEAARELDGYGEISLFVRAKNLARRLLGRYVPERDRMFWPAGLLLLGMSEYLALGERKPGALNEETRRAVQASMDRHLAAWERDGGRLFQIDDVLAGAAFAARYEATGEEKYLAVCDRMYDFAAERSEDRTGAVIYRPGRAHDYVLADGVGELALFLSRYALVRPQKREEALMTAGRQLCAFREYGFDRTTGLPFHGYEAQQGGGIKTKGLVGWGRAVGWYLMGLSGYLTAVCDRAVTDGRTEVLLSLVESCRREDGMFTWHLAARSEDGKEIPVDTSATAMISYAESVLFPCGEGAAVSAGTLDRAAGALRSWTDPQGRVQQALAECIDFGNHPQNYGNYPWGQGAVLAFLSRLER